MDEYISRGAAIALYEDGDFDMSNLKVPIPVIIQNLKDIPAADVVPVVRGRWQHWTENVAIPYFTCDNCGFGSLDTHNYCPNCGADMRQKEV